MNANALNRSLLRLVGIGWAAFAIAALALRFAFASPSIVLLVDRSYCDPADWEAVASEYETLYQQDQRDQIQIESVIFFSDLGQDVAETPPTPEDFAAFTTYGRPSLERQDALLADYPNAQLLSCSP
jgi:hypothetical protein